MLDFSTADMDALLLPGGHACACGRHHATTLRYLQVKPGALRFLPEALAAAGGRRPFVVCDANTHRVAGARVCALLSGANIPYSLYVYPETPEKMEPDEAAAGSLAMAFDPACDCVLAVGSGVVNDCCKVLAHAAGLPSLVVATAPSMDGYASNSSSMIRQRIKVTLYNACPVGIIADTDILRQAPMPMLHAGLGDMLAKYVSLCEWRISNLVTGEHYCENVAGLVRASLDKCVAAAEGLVRREPAAVEAVANGLILSGVAMSYEASSRPASGLEHYFSHMWEMMALNRGEASALHGIQVGVGTALTLSLLSQVRAITPDRGVAEAAMRSFSQEAWEAEMRDIFGPTAGAIIAAEKNDYHKNDPPSHQERLSRILLGWGDIQAIYRETLPDTASILATMRQLGMAVTPGDLGISPEETRRAFIGSREIRDKYLTSSMLWDLGLLHRYAPTVGA